MAAASVDVQYFSPANRPCSLASFNRRLAKPQLSNRVPCASRLALCVSSTVLRLQEPLDSACRPFLRIGGDDEIDEAYDENETDEEYQGISNEDAERIATSSNGSTTGAGEEYEIRSNGVTHEFSGPNVVLSSHLSSAASPEIAECERLRRWRIGIANKGKTPWNKGKSHSPETIALMSERNKIVMQDPKIREKLRQYSHPQSLETRKKISIFMKSRMEYEKKQLTIMQDWKDSIAMMARRGLVGDDELQWDSYHVLKKELHRQFYAAKKKKRKADGRKSLQYEHRLRISESVRTKWADPEYRRKVVERIHETRQKGPRTFRDRLADTEFDRLLHSLTNFSTESSPSNSKVGSYNDPQAEEKLRKIKMLRERNTIRKESDLETVASGFQFGDLLEEEKAKPMGVEVQDTICSVTALGSAQVADMDALQQAHRQATERARILLAEAERAALLAAEALDAAGAHDEALNDSLLEAWTLLDEANKSILNLELTTLSRN